MDESVALGERDLDVALEVFLQRSPSFRDRFLEQIIAGSVALHDVHFVDARRSGATRGGQTDVLVEWKTADASLVVLIESKLNATFQPRQGERYRERSALLARDGTLARTVLIAPRQYLAVANVQSSQFDIQLAVEDVIQWMAESDDAAPSDLARLREALRRVENGLILGAKGLWPDLHRDVEDECVRRGNGLRIRNNKTRVLFIDFPGAPGGVALKYRAHTRIAEIVIGKAYKGDRASVAERVSPRFLLKPANTELFVRQKSPAFTASDEPEPSAKEIVDALEDLLSWWRAHETASASSTILQG